MPEDSRADLIKQRSMLVLLLSACRTAQSAFEAAGNPVDVRLTADLSEMIERSQEELDKLEERIEVLPKPAP